MADNAGCRHYTPFREAIAAPMLIFAADSISR